jgi:hypothetical protein
MTRFVVVLSILGACALAMFGCGNAALLHDFACKGKATIVGGGSGFSGINGVVDCGDGFELRSGTEKKTDAPKP